MYTSHRRCLDPNGGRSAHQPIQTEWEFDFVVRDEKGCFSHPPPQDVIQTDDSKASVGRINGCTAAVVL